MNAKDIYVAGWKAAIESLADNDVPTEFSKNELELARDCFDESDDPALDRQSEK